MISLHVYKNVVSTLYFDFNYNYHFVNRFISISHGGSCGCNYNVYHPVCGVDGLTYPNDCIRHSQWVESPYLTKRKRLYLYYYNRYRCWWIIRDRPFNLKGRGLWFFVSFRNFFSDNTRVRIFIFFVARSTIFFSRI